MRVLIASLVVLLPLTVAAGDGGLLGSTLSLRTIAQATPDSEAIVSSFPALAIVDVGRVEFPDVESLSITSAPLPENFSRYLVNVSIDAGADYIEIGFHDAGPPSYFAPAHLNTYVFTFESEQAIFFRGARINRFVTTLGLDDEDVWFVGNELYVNVEGIPYDETSFVRIDLAADLMMM